MVRSATGTPSPASVAPRSRRTRYGRALGDRLDFVGANGQAAGRGSQGDRRQLLQRRNSPSQSGLETPAASSIRTLAWHRLVYEGRLGISKYTFRLETGGGYGQIGSRMSATW
jgi:hypothetical protein